MNKLSGENYKVDLNDGVESLKTALSNIFADIYWLCYVGNESKDIVEIWYTPERKELYVDSSHKPYDKKIITIPLKDWPAAMKITENILDSILSADASYVASACLKK